MSRAGVPEWRHIPFLGTELTSRDEVISQPFEFPSLESIINKHLRKSPNRKAFLWASTQPIQLDDIVTIPVILVCFCDTKLPPLVCVHSTQSSTDDIINLNDRGENSVDWTNYASRIFFLPVEGQGPPGFPTTKPRSTPLPPPPPPSSESEAPPPPVLAEGELNLVFTDPYIVRPGQIDSLKKERTKLLNYRHIPFEFEFKGKSYNDYYVKSSSTTLDEYLQESVEDNNIEEADATEYKNLVRETMEKSREKKIKEFDDRIEMIEKTDPLIKQARIVKVYPSHPHLDLSKSYSNKINSVLGDADEVIGEVGPRARLREKNIRKSISRGNSIYGLPKILEEHEQQKKEEQEEIQKVKEEKMKEMMERKKRKRDDKVEGEPTKKTTKKRKMKRKLRYSIRK